MPARPQADEAALLAAIAAELTRIGGAPPDLDDDCAFLCPTTPPTALVTTDTLVEGVHFDRRWDTLEQVGAQAAVQNLSDLAASGGAAGWLVWSLCLPPTLREPAAVAALTRGFAGMAVAYGAAIVGGNLCRTPGPLTLTVTAGGPLLGPAPLLRCGARPGDAVFLTGAVGDAALGVAAPDPETRAARHAWRPHLAEAALLARPEAGVSACMDVSDGVLLDASRLAQASCVTLDLSARDVPRSPLYRVRLGDDPRLALTGGEDYVLLFTAPAAPAGLTVYPVGVVRPAVPGAPLLVDGRPTVPGGFDHFATTGAG